MVENKQDILARAFATLSSLRNNINQMTTYNVLETYVIEYHTVLDRLEAVGKDVSEFRIPDSVVKPLVTSQIWKDERSYKTYSDEKYVEKALLLIRLDAILGYFEIITSEKPRRIGFPKPDNR